MKVFHGCQDEAQTQELGIPGLLWPGLSLPHQHLIKAFPQSILRKITPIHQLICTPSVVR
jgi:hypothetical protein